MEIPTDYKHEETRHMSQEEFKKIWLGRSVNNLTEQHNHMLKLGDKRAIELAKAMKIVSDHVGLNERDESLMEGMIQWYDIRN